MGKLLEDCKVFYQDFVQEKCLTMPASEEIAVIIKFVEEEEARGKYYIH